MTVETPALTREITLYRGDNGVHEFYENDHGYSFEAGTEPPVLIFRNHGEARWTAMVDWSVQDGSYEHPEGWMRELAGTLAATVRVQTDREWRYNDHPEPIMVLTEVQ